MKTELNFLIMPYVHERVLTNQVWDPPPPNISGKSESKYFKRLKYK